MQAVILAAGEGKRLRPLTENIPKPMIDVQGHPILEYVIAALPEDTEEIIFVIGHRGEAIKNHFGRSFLGKHITYVSDVLPGGTGYALQQARPFLKNGHFILLNGDDLYHPEDLKIASLRRPTVFVRRSTTPERFGVCLVKDDGTIARIIEKPLNPPSTLVNTGGYILNHGIFEIPVPVLPNGELNLAEQIGAWATRRSVYAHEARFWNPINTFEELEDARKLNLKELFPDLFA